jgi:hypothetical protein
LSSLLNRTTRLVRVTVGLACLVASLVACIPAVATAKDALSTYADIAQYAIPGAAGAISIARKDGAGFLQLGVGAGVTYGVTEDRKNKLRFQQCPIIGIPLSWLE